MKNRKWHFLENLSLITGKEHSTPNAYKIIVVLITRAKVMILCSLTENQS